MSDIVQDAWKKYLIQLKAHPLRTKAITAGVLSGFSDTIAQKMSGAKKLQLRRLLLVMLYGFAYVGPFNHFFHKFLEIIFGRKSDNKTVAKKVAVDQLTASPWHNWLFMMYFGLIVEGNSWKAVNTKIKKDFLSVQWTSWKFWPIIGWVNYQYMPFQLRVLFGNVMGVCWRIFLILKARSTAAALKQA